MKLSIAVFLSFFLANIAFAQKSSSDPPVSKPKSEECAVSGMVVKLAGSEPVKTATVQLQSLQDLAHTLSVVTDVGGRFELKGFEPGRYRLKVSRTGFVTQEYGQKTPNETRSEEHTSELQSRGHLVCRLLLEKKKKKK